MATYFMKRTLPQLLIVVTAVWMIIEFFITPKWWTDIGSQIRNYTILISAFALGLGAVAAFAYHIPIIIKRTAGRWFYSLVLIISCLVMIVTGLNGWLDNPTFSFIWNNITVPCQQTVYGLLMFYVAIAAYRSMKISSVEAIIFTLCGVIIMWANAPLLQYYVPQITDIANWILGPPNVGAARGFALAATVGLIALYVRVLLGRELGMVGATKAD